MARPVRRRRSEKGFETVESALTLVLFLIFFIGIADFGQILLVHNSLVERVRMATRTSAVQNLDAASTRNLVMYGTVTVPSGVTPTPFMGLQESNIAVVRADVGTTAQRLIVTVSNVPYHTVSPYLAKTASTIPVTAVLSLEIP